MSHIYFLFKCSRAYLTINYHQTGGVQMGITVRDALKIQPLTQGELIAGKNGLDRIIKSVSVIEIPKETQWFRGGELQISALYSIANDEKSQLEVLENLNKCNCSGLVLCHVGFWLKSIHPSLIKLADKINFPIIRVPDNIAYIDIITPIIDNLLNIQNQKWEYALQVSEKMTNIVLDNKDINYLMYSLEKLLNRTILFFDSNNQCLTCIKTKLSNALVDEIKNLIQINLNQYSYKSNFIKVVSKLTSKHIILAPIVIGTMYYGTIAILDVSNLNEMNMIAVSETKNSCALALMKKTKFQEFISTSKTNYYIDLLEWNFNDEEDAITRAQSMDLQVSKIRLVMSLDISKLYIQNNQLDELGINSLREKLYTFVLEEVKVTESINYVMQYKKKIVLFINSCGDYSKTLSFAKNFGKKIINSAFSYLNLPIFVGIGNYYLSLSRIQNSYSESIDTLNIGSSIFDESHCVAYQEIELFALLFENIDGKKVSSILKRLSEPLQLYDKQNGTSLLATLKALIEHQFDTSVVSEKLYLHRNTVLQRKKKISELLEVNPDEYPYRLLYEIANILEKIISK